MVILFRPFDLPKWCVIGFSAFLAGLLSGGNGGDVSLQIPNFQGSQPSFNFRATNVNQASQQATAALNHLMSAFTTGIVVMIVIGFFLFVLGLIVLLYWLGARGQFLLLDNIVRNRAVIAGPWNHYAVAGNRVFTFYLICAGAGMVVASALFIPAILISLPSWRVHHWPAGGTLASLIVLAVLYVSVVVAFYTALFLFREWGIPLMFRNGLNVRDAIREVWQLVRDHPGTTALFLLLRLALFIGVIVISSLLCCLTCCCGERIPYVGTVMLLPVILYVKCFSLDCLAQFGPAYDVWTVDVPPADPAAAAALS